MRSPLLSLRILQVFSVSWQATVFAFITLLLPESLLPVGIIGSLTGVSLAAASVFRGRSAWAKLSVLEMWFVFFVLLVSQALTNLIGQYLPITLLQSVMILFTFELLTVNCDFRNQFPNGVTLEWNSAATEALPNRFVQHVFRTVSRAGLLFASCYALSIAILFLSASAVLSTPLITDISLYIVVVSVSLALLLLFRED